MIGRKISKVVLISELFLNSYAWTTLVVCCLSGLQGQYFQFLEWDEWDKDKTYQLWCRDDTDFRIAKLEMKINAPLNKVIAY